MRGYWLVVGLVLLGLVLALALHDMRRPQDGGPPLPPPEARPGATEPPAAPPPEPALAAGADAARADPGPARTAASDQPEEPAATPPGVPVVTGRFVFEDGRPWPSCSVRAQALLSPLPGGYPATQSLAVDAQGRFSLPLPFPRPPGGSRRYLFSGSDPGGRGTVLAFQPLDEPPPGGDLGDVLLDLGPLLCGGRVVDARGQPIAGARLRLAERTTAQDQRVLRPVFTSGQAISGADGAFALHLPAGELAPEGQLELAAERPGYLPDEHRETARGVGGLVIVLLPAGALSGWLRLDDGLEPADVALTLAGERELPVDLRDDRTFGSEQLPAGVFALQVRRRGVDGRLERQPAVVVGELRIEPGRTNRDDRLQGLFVAGNLRALRLTVVDPRGRPIAGATATLAGLRGARAMPAGRDGVCRVRAPSLPADVVVAAFGYRPRTLQGLAADATVQLEDGIAVRLATAARARGAPACRLGVLLCEVDAAGRPGSRVHGDAFPAAQRFFDQDGSLALRLPGPGVYEVEVFVSVVGADHVGRSSKVALASPPRLAVADRTGEQTFELDLPQQAVDEAVRTASR